MAKNLHVAWIYSCQCTVPLLENKHSVIQNDILECDQEQHWNNILWLEARSWIGCKMRFKPFTFATGSISPWWQTAAVLLPSSEARDDKAEKAQPCYHHSKEVSLHSFHSWLAAVWRNRRNYNFISLYHSLSPREFVIQGRELRKVLLNCY